MSAPASAGPLRGTVQVTYIVEDPQAPSGAEPARHVVEASRGDDLMHRALESGIEIDHACGGVCACSTCHVYVEQGMQHLTEASEAEEDRVEEAPGLQRNSRLSCQCQITGPGPIVVRVPAWNRNAVKEGH